MDVNIRSKPKPGQKVVPFLAFDNQAEEAVNLYVSLFPDSRILSLTRSGDGGPIPKGLVLHASFQLGGSDFMAMDGGSSFSFGQGISLFVNCETQEEIDRLSAGLSEGGEQMPCGWVKDRFGVSWQIVPTVLGRMMNDAKAGNPGNVMQALMGMRKIDIATLQRAYRK